MDLRVEIDCSEWDTAVRLMDLFAKEGCVVYMSEGIMRYYDPEFPSIHKVYRIIVDKSVSNGFNFDSRLNFNNESFTETLRRGNEEFNELYKKIREKNDLRVSGEYTFHPMFYDVSFSEDELSHST